MQSGRIIKAYSGYYYVLDSTDGEIYECSLRGRFRQGKLDFYVGDKVKFTIIDGNEGVIEESLPRSVQLKRPTVANVEQVVLVFATQNPKFNYQLLDKFILLAEAYQLDVLLCLNKVDLVGLEQATKLMALYEGLGYQVIYTDIESEIGLPALKKELAAQISVLAGPSGVGKSSLINLLNSEAKMATQQLSTKLKQGKHTTRHVELIALDNGALVADTPGFTNLDISFITPAQLSCLFKEMQEYLDVCKFNNCQHTHEPKCGVKKAVAEAKIDSRRYNNYLKFLDEIKED